MDAAKFRWLVGSGRLFMPRADRLGDPLEGTAPLGESEWWKREAASADSDKRRKIIEHNQRFLSRMAAMLRNEYYVSCWHMNIRENIEMWNEYTSGSESIAVKSTYGTLRSLLPVCVMMGVVRYIDYSIDRLPTMNMFEYITHKHIRYSFECEVRAVATRPPVKELGQEEFVRNLFESKSMKGFYVYAPPVDIAKMIHEVVLHPNASDDFAASIREICAAIGLPEPRASLYVR